MNPDYKEIGKNIRLMRIRHGISQSELAQRLDVSQTHMSNLEHGRVRQCQSEGIATFGAFL